jgi:hypothetical protein
MKARMEADRGAEGVRRKAKLAALLLRGREAGVKAPGSGVWIGRRVMLRDDNIG